MKPASFRYHRASSVDDAVDALVEHEDPRLLAGGQSMIREMNERISSPATVVDISSLEELEYIREMEDAIALGALTPLRDAERSDLVAEFLPLVGKALARAAHPTIRNKATIGGNLSYADPSSELPAAALVRGATFRISGPDGERTVGAADFFTGHKETALEADEMLVGIEVPKADPDRGYGFAELSPKENSWAIAGAAASLAVEDGACTDARLGYLAVGDTPLRVPAAEAAVEGEPPTTGTFETAGATARERVDPPADVHGTSEYRERLVETLTVDALEDATRGTTEP